MTMFDAIIFINITWKKILLFHLCSKFRAQKYSAIFTERNEMTVCMPIPLVPVEMWNRIDLKIRLSGNLFHLQKELESTEYGILNVRVWYRGDTQTLLVEGEKSLSAYTIYSNGIQTLPDHSWAVLMWKLYKF